MKTPIPCLSLVSYHWLNIVMNCLKFVIFYLDPGEYVVKAQILAGGRGLGVFDSGFKGGVHLTKE